MYLCQPGFGGLRGGVLTAREGNRISASLAEIYMPSFLVFCDVSPPGSPIPSGDNAMEHCRIQGNWRFPRTAEIYHFWDIAPMCDDDEELVATFVPILLRYSLNGMRLMSGELDRPLVGSQNRVAHKFWENMKAARNGSRFRQTLRCEPNAFDAIVEIVAPEFDLLFDKCAIQFDCLGFYCCRYIRMYGKPHHNALYDIELRIATTLYYLGRGTAMEDAATQFGISRTSAVRCCWSLKICFL
jgi:hypothetical protein